MTTSWGIRTLVSTLILNTILLYTTMGCLATCYWMGWRLAKSCLQEPKKAVQYLSSMADRILSENGMFAETYRGDRPEPFNSCILQAWSVGMYVYAFRELMVGSTNDTIDNTVEINPQIPEYT